MARRRRQCILATFVLLACVLPLVLTAPHAGIAVAASRGLGYVALILVLLILAMSPWTVLRGHRAAFSSMARRDVGTSTAPSSPLARDGAHTLQRRGSSVGQGAAGHATWWSRLSNSRNSGQATAGRSLNAAPELYTTDVGRLLAAYRTCARLAPAALLGIRISPTCGEAMSSGDG
jgi:hypothetical protein